MNPQETKTMNKFALLSNASYDTSKHGRDIAQKNLNKHLPNHFIIPKFTDNNSSVIVKNEPNKQPEVTISYRGTNIFNPSDLIADASIISGLSLSPRFQEAENKYKLVKAEYPNANIITTGHSLGATQSLDVAKKNNLESYNFNIGSSPFSTNDKEGKTAHIYHTIGDLISLSNAIADKNDIIYNIAPLNISSQLAQSAGLGVINPIAGLAGLTYTEFIGIHGLHNFLPQETFEGDLDSTDINYSYLKSLIQQPVNTKTVIEYEKQRKICINKISGKVEYCIK